MKSFLPFLAMVTVQICFSGMNIVMKLALESGMNPFVLTTYRQIFATVVLAPLACFLEWKSLPKITGKIAFQVTLCSLFGATLNQCLYIFGIKYTTPTIGCGLTNLLPAITFIMALVFRMETLGLKSLAGQAKIFGTILCVGGAMFLSFYKGSLFNSWHSAFHWHEAEKGRILDSEKASFVGPLLVMASCLAWATWFIIQGKMSSSFSAPYTTTASMCFMAIFECGLIAVSVEHSPKAWSLGSGIRLIAAIYNGVVGSAVTFYLMSWCIEKRGPLYVSAFSPLVLVFVAILGWALLDEAVYLGRAVGAILIIVGLYVVVWGKGKEQQGKEQEPV